MVEKHEFVSVLTDAEIGANVRRCRGDRSQKEIAERMVVAGYKWTQTTVFEVEKGKRALKLTEASALTEVLGVPTSYLEQVPEGYFVERNAFKASAELDDAADRALDAVVEFDRARNTLRSLLLSMRDSEVLAGHESTYQKLVDRTLLQSLKESATRRGSTAKRDLRVIEGEITNEWLSQRGPHSSDSIPWA